ncbi:CAAX amino terminal protease [Cucumis melo var. makuwa]|uniref:CAAX amino terminal protease n=1 Tax=Cucumis melo var. makuwa TaxID=1194695 RepID=A0A5A7UYW8_CUCMM|nr:CAAX amino terminal protease [Cucumis melo var. makuwa]
MRDPNSFSASRRNGRMRLSGCHRGALLGVWVEYPFDEVVKLSPHARAIRDVEDEELRSFFYGMSPWQFILIVAASSVGEELFYRAAVQGALADIFLRSPDIGADVQGMASLTGVLPPFVPFAQGFAAFITAALTGSLYYVAASPKDPTYVVAPVASSLNSSYSYILNSSSNVFTWSGSLTNSDNQELVERLLDLIKPNVQSRSQKEGSESEQFWNLLGGKSEYPSQKISRDAESDPHLFSCILSRGSLGDPPECVLRSFGY